MKRWIIIFSLFLLFSACPNRSKIILLVFDRNSREAQLAAEQIQPGAMVQISNSFFENELDQHPQVWIHLPEKTEWDQLADQIDFSPLVDWYHHGGKLILSGFACHIPARIGIESVAPEARSVEIDVSDLGTRYGFQGWRDHPVFAGLWGGVHILHTDSAFTDWRIAYFDSLWPQQGQVIGIEKQHFFYQHQTKSLWEYNHPDCGKIMCIGGFLHFDKENLQSAHARKLLQNIISYQQGEMFGIHPTWWFAHDNQPRPFTPAPFEVTPTPVRPDQLQASTLAIGRTPGQDAYCEAAGKRILIMGKEKGGIDETWVHPFRAFKNFRLGIIRPDGIAWLDELPDAFVNRPEAFRRSYSLPDGKIEETVFADRDQPAGYVCLQNFGEQSLEIVVQSLFDLRLMWPYEQHVLGPVFYGSEPTTRTVQIRDSSASFYCIMGADRSPKQDLVGPFDHLEFGNGALNAPKSPENQVLFGAIYELPPQQTTRIIFSASNQGRDEAVAAFRNLAEHGSERYNVVVDYYRQLLQEKTVIHSPDTIFNQSYLWKLVAIDRFFVETPPFGTAMLAGMGTTARGWGGGHRISGRPGYAWYFGRDAVWSCFAVNNYGDFESVKQQLHFFAKFQDLAGKIFHELSTSGGLHFDAADATPLYLNLAAHYLRASGDLQTIRELWPSLMRAMDYLYSTDTDGDGLIENTRVGHGWIEGGKLYGAHTTCYLAGLWCQTLRDAAYLGQAIGQTGRNRQFLTDAARVHQKLNTDFYLDSLDYYSLGLWPGGTYHTEKTSMPNVPMIFGLLDSAQTATMLDEWGSDKFSTDWGVRIVSRESPLFNQRGYHYGSIWPLFTGWTALAEYRYGRPERAFQHVVSTMNIFDDWGLGYTEEVLHGEIYQPSGVCSHQCWSETNVIHPLITGMLGFEPDALQKTVTLFPQFPAEWPTFRVTNLRVGNSVFNLEMTKSDRITWNFSRVRGEPLQIIFKVRNDATWPLKAIVATPAKSQQTENQVSFMLETSARLELLYHSLAEK